ncbi:MAG: leucine-rich repeat protein, partial [Bacteroidaceae bacterium]|nr:leucine-rich repeat protein [Bacteroidaceae bacterium]
CNYLSDVNILNPSANIAFNAFDGTAWLEGLPEGLVYLGKTAYKYKGTMPSDTNITIKEGTTDIAPYAFQNCTGLSSISLPSTLKNIGSYAFAYCSGLTSITIPESITSISPSTFYGCKGLSEVTLPEGVTTIGSSAFGGCSGLTSVSLPVSLKSIGESSFSGCSGLTSITLPSCLESIGAYAFQDCRLTSIDSRMKDPVLLYSNPFCTYSANTWLSYTGNCTLYVQAGSKEAYKASAVWNTFKEIIELDTDVEAFDNVIYMDSTEVRSGSQATLSFKMKNKVAIRGFQFDLYKPEGVTVVKSSKGRIQATLCSDRLPEDDEHTLTCSEQTDGAIRFLCNSQYDETFTGDDGELITLLVNVTEEIENGNYAIRMRNMKLTESDISMFYTTDLVQSSLTVVSYLLGDINSDGEVDISDYTGVANHIHGSTPVGFSSKAADVDENGTIDVSDYTGVANIIHTGSAHGNSQSALGKRKIINIETTDITNLDNVIYITPFSTVAGTELTLSLQMKNSVQIRGFQFDLYLPEGMTVTKSSKGRIQGMLTANRLPDEDEHDLSFSEQPDGAIRFLCSSQYDETFTGNDGELITLQVTVSDDMAYGSHPIQLKNMKLTETDISKYYHYDLIVSSVTISTVTGLNPSLQLKSSNAELYNLKGQRIGRPLKGVFLQNGKKKLLAE